MVGPAINKTINVVVGGTVTFTLGTYVYEVVHNEVSGDAESQDAPASQGEGSGERKANPAKGDSPVWSGLENDKNGRKNNGKKGKKKETYEWDHTHNDIEVYDHGGRHKGSMDPATGEIYKPPVKGRKIDL